MTSPRYGDDDGVDALPRRSPGLLQRRLPMWAALVGFAAVAVILAVLLVLQRRSAVDVGRAVGVAERVEVQMTLCNDAVDRLKLNPRRAELDLEEVLRGEGARTVKVTVERMDCPPRR